VKNLSEERGEARGSEVKSEGKRGKAREGGGKRGKAMQLG